MSLRILAASLALAASVPAETHWETAQFKDGSEIDYGFSDLDYKSHHKLQIAIGGWFSPNPLFPVRVGWYEPGKFKLNGSLSNLDLSWFLFSSEIDDSARVQVNSEYVGNNTINVYTTDIPYLRGLEHGPHLAIDHQLVLGDDVFGGVSLGYAWTWTTYYEFFVKPGKKEKRHTKSKQKTLSIDLQGFYSEGEFHPAVRILLDGFNSLPLTDRFGLSYMIGCGYSPSLVPNMNWYPLLGLGLQWGFM